MSYEGIVATRCRTLSSSTPTNHQLMARSAHVATDAISALRIVHQNFTVTGSVSTETGNGATATVNASVEYPAGTFTQITYDTGSTSGTVPAAGIKFSDYVTIPGGIPAGATFHIRTFHQNASGIVYNNWRSTLLGELMTVGNALSDQTMGGTIVSSGNFSHPPLAIIGLTTKASVCIVGDSIGWGFHDTPVVEDARQGIIARGFPSTLPFVNLSSGGMQAKTFPTLAAARKLILPYCSHVICELCNNDINVAGSSVATLTTDLQAFYATLVNGQRVTQTTCSPKTTSTDSWATTANQTLVSSESRRLDFNNNRVRSGSLVGVNNSYFEIAWLLETAHDSGLWINDGSTPNLNTNDGLHPQNPAYVIGSGGVNMALITDPPSSSAGGPTMLGRIQPSAFLK